MPFQTRGSPELVDKLRRRLSWLDRTQPLLELLYELFQPNAGVEQRLVRHGLQWVLAAELLRHLLDLRSRPAPLAAILPTVLDGG